MVGKLPQCDVTGAARCYLRGNFSVVPVKSGTKEPAVMWKNYQHQFMSESLVPQFFNPHINIAIVTGRISDLTVLDVDDAGKFNEFYNFERLEEQSGVVIKTPRGYHFYFKYNPAVKTAQHSNYGFDLKSDGGLVVAPPSVVNQHRYFFLKSGGITEMPAELKKKLLRLQESKNPSLERILSRLTIARQLSDGTYRCFCPAHNDQEPSLDVGLRDGKIHIHCWAGCEKEDVLRAIGLQEPETGKDKDNTTRRLLQLVEKFEIWLNQNGDEFITVCINNSVQNVRIDSKEFRKILQYLYFQKFGKPAHSQAIIEAVNTLCGKAFVEGKRYRSFIRVGKNEEVLELDLLNGKVIQITKEEITLTDGICKFEHLPNLLPLPFPDFNVNKDDWKGLSHFVNADEEALFLVLSWLLGCFNIDGEFPILNIIGKREGIGKSTACRYIKSILDPAVVNNKPLPRCEDDLLVVCTHNHIVSFDNISTISDSISDALCRIATGSGIAKRKLFTDRDASIHFVKNPLILNGIDLFAERRDLRRRCIHVELQMLANPKPIQHLELVFSAVHPKILGWLINAVQLALREGLSEDAELTDMATFVSFVCKTEKLFPISSNKFVELFKTNRSNISIQTVFEDPITQVLTELAENKWQGTVTELHNVIAQKFQFTRHQIPKDARALSRKIRRMLGDLENVGIFCEFCKKESGTHIIIKKVEENISSNSSTPETLKNKALRTGDISGNTGDISGISPEISPVQKTIQNNDFDETEDNGDILPEPFNENETNFWDNISPDEEVC